MAPRWSSLKLPKKMSEFDSIEALLKTHLPPDALAQVESVLYGKKADNVEVSKSVQQRADQGHFQVKAVKFTAAPMQRTTPRIVKIALIQNTIKSPTTAGIDEQYSSIEAAVELMLDAAAEGGANICCLQEAWTAPFFFCTREKQPWNEFAEVADLSGRSCAFISRKARQHNMVIVSPMYERDVVHGDTCHNTAVVFSHTGAIIGKHRKNHIPRVGDFNESTYYMEGDDGHPVFDTIYGKIAINICYGRHHPLNWMMFGLNGAEIVFNPSATVGSLSEPLWPIEARNAAIANSYFVGSINRVGTEEFPNGFTSGDGKPAKTKFGHFYGSSYVSAPNGGRCEGLSRVRDGVLIAELDLNLIRQTRDHWGYQMTSRFPLYAQSLSEFVKPDYEPQVIRDSALPK